MAKANVNDRQSIYRAYPRGQFEQDVGVNARAAGAVFRGVKILSQPDGQGNFEISAVAQHVGEGDPQGDSVFLAPQRDERLDPGGAVAAQQTAALAPADLVPDQSDRYEAFVDRIMSTAKSVDFKPEIGRDPRLRGFHGG
jgi:hypothetical protein